VISFNRPALLGVVAIAVTASGTLGIGLAEAVGRSGGHSSASSYGTMPSYLPASSLRPDRVLVGSAARPALSTEGDAIRADLPHRSVLVTVSGPEVPGEGLPYQAAADTATWAVTMSDASGSVPISTKAFSAIDSFGAIYHPTFVPGQRRPPAEIRPGQTVHFELRVVMRVGEGMMRWAPVGNDLLATWDFVVEND
jgi:hypothetical protein